MQYALCTLFVLLPMLIAACHLCPLTKSMSASSTYEMSLTSAQACEAFDRHITAGTIRLPHTLINKLCQVDGSVQQQLPATYNQPVLSKHVMQGCAWQVHARACQAHHMPWHFTCSWILTIPQSTEAARALTCCCWAWYLPTSLLKVSRVRVPLPTSPLIPSIDSCALVTTRSLQTPPHIGTMQ